MRQLFPKHMPLDRLKSIVQRVPDDRGGHGDYGYYLREKIVHFTFTPDYLHALRTALTEIVLNGLSWNDKTHPHVQTHRPDIVPVLIAACCRQAAAGVTTPDWVQIQPASS
jgi:hypothetical protein